MQVRAVVQGLDAERAAQSAYVLRTFLRTLGLPHTLAAEPPEDASNAVLLWYGTSAPPADAAAVVELACLEPPGPDTPIAWATRRACGERIAFLGGHRAAEGAPTHVAEAGGEPLVAWDGTHCRIGFDLVASAGFWLTGGDETPDRVDALGRVRGAAGPRHEAGLATTPVITALMRLLWECLRQAAFAAGLAVARLNVWPGRKRLALLLSHDVDLWRKRTARQLAKELLRSGLAPRRLPSVLKAFCWGPDPWALEPIADLEAHHGARSTFFLLPGRPDRRVGGIRVVNGYPVADEAIAAVARRLVERGWEIALHGSFGPAQTAESLAEERRAVQRLSGQPVAGVRQHFLRLERPATWRNQLDAGLLYDATLGYPDTIGYRAGFSFPFHPFADGAELPLLELPLVVMDGALWNEQRLGAAEAWACLQPLLQRTRDDGALLSLLWHNTHFCDLDAPGYRRLYERLLEQAQDGWAVPAGEIAAWWRRRAAVSLAAQHDASRTRIVVASQQPVADLCVSAFSASPEARSEDSRRHEVRLENCAGKLLEACNGHVSVLLEEIAGEAGTIEVQWE